MDSNYHPYNRFVIERKINNGESYPEIMEWIYAQPIEHFEKYRLDILRYTKPTGYIQMHP